MRIALLAPVVGLALGLSACSGSGQPPGGPVGGLLASLNPFGRAREVVVSGPAAPPGLVLRRDDTRGLVDQVTGLSVEPMPGGAVIEASGLPRAQGYWDADLVPVGSGGDTLVYEMRVAPPAVLGRVGPPASREVVTATSVADAALRGVSAIQVRGLGNALEVRR